MTSTLRIIKKSTAPKLSPRAQGSLTYHIEYDETDKTFSHKTATQAVKKTSLLNESD